jgi:hypothetical protein
MPEESVPSWKLDPRWLLAQRVAASPVFEKSKRLQSFVLFVAERAIRDPGAAIHDADIRREVFGRHPEPLAGEDSLVRVQASHLRRRLAQYFATSGAGEPVVIELPLGAYTAVFRARPAGPSTAPPRAPPTARRHVALAARIALMCAAIALSYYAGTRTGPRPEAHPAVPGPAVARLWRQMFEDRPVSIVVSDGTLTLLQDAAQYQWTVAEYQRQDFTTVVGDRLPPGHRPWGWRLMNRRFTPISDAALVARMSALNAAQGRTSEVVHARQAGAGHFHSRDVVLVGPRRANPWLELFEPRLRFRSGFEEGTRRAWLENVAPAPGEAAQYFVTWNQVGYCRVAFLPNLGGTGTALIISGTDMSSTDAGTEFITSERWVVALRDRLGAGHGPLPHFEVLLKAQLVLTTASRVEIVAHRRLP